MHSDYPGRSFSKHESRFRHVPLSGQVYLIVFIAILFLVSCKSSTDVQQDGLYGKWEIHKALRNGVETHYLRRGYFIIDPDGTMTVNITGTEERGTFHFDNNKLKLNEAKEFIVESQNQDSMALRYIMNENSTFLFYLTKQMNEKN